MIGDSVSDQTKTGRPPRRLSFLGDRLPIVVLLLSAAASLLIFLWPDTTSPENRGSAPRPTAPDFSAPRLDGGELRLSDLRGQPVVINFWASWCAPCRAEAGELERVWQAYRDQGVVFVGVNIQDSEEGALGFVRDYRVSYPTVRDAANEIAVSYAVVGLPATYFIDREGRVAGHWSGALTEKQLVARLEEALQ